MSDTPDRVDPSAAAMQGVNGYWRALDADDIRRGEHRTMIGAMWDDIGTLQFEFLRRQGLQPFHRLLDVGCGSLRGGVHFVRYLDKGRYCGIDANASLVDAGHHELALAGLDQRGARLVADANFDVGRFGETFDYAIAVSVITHLFTDHIQACLKRVRHVLEQNGTFYVTFFEAPETAHLDPITHAPGEITTSYTQDPFHQSFEELQTLAARVGMRARLIGDFGHPRGQRMAAFSPL
ncbi:class I SAM-dependent methyltransferase [Dokdonella sp. MW10]|uniref:class I SAM-dependent methyltransferase n=1 Tax=Dokdonella sp. MW10 TaxID=2992926 RepID=UPI003F7E7C01